MPVPHKLPQTLSPLFADVVSNCWEVTAIVGQLAIVECVASDLTIDRRSMTTELARHFFDRQFTFDKVEEAAAIGPIQLRIASGHSKISKGKPLKSLACRT
ncbi:hypothetical protein BC360_20570 [Ensifer sp. LC163]|nr:hypothetical protein BC360_20570 [Ensifer sp. LC163]